MSSNGKPRYTAPAAACAADLMLTLARDGAPMSVSDLARSIEQSKSLVYRVLHELEDRQYVSKLPDGRYWLALAVVELGGAFSASVPLMSSVRRVLRTLADKTGETVNLGVLRGADVLYLAREEGARSIFAVSHVGKLLPANCVALGKVLLARLGDAELCRRLQDQTDASGRLRSLTASSIDTLGALRDELDRIRELGHAEERGESVPGRCCAAVAVRLTATTEDHVAISISMDEARWDHLGAEVVAHLHEARDQIERDVDGRELIGEPTSLGDVFIEGLTS